MSCRQKRLLVNAAVLVDTWTGLRKEDDVPTLICRVDGLQKVKHFVEIHNLKTYDRKFRIKASVMHDKIEFQGSGDRSAVVSRTGGHWDENANVRGAFGFHICTFGGVQISKKSPGADSIRVSIEHSDPWSRQFIRVNADVEIPIDAV
jgi:hypothetical protein